MLTEQAHSALLLLHRRASKSCDTFELERIDRALDEIVRLNSLDPAPFQIRSAMAHAGAVMCRRHELAPATALENLKPHQEPGYEDTGCKAVDLLAWLQTTPALSAKQRWLLQRLIEDEDPADLAATLSIPLFRMRERISRLRKRARTAYTQAVAT
ncbi:hypothetical protein [Streptomyces sp. NPDC014746]|uniref:hypothetical protein n=1 Tax=Streptomyces sp. NPDC014746 TaxID=3364904 RepID=UPI0036FAFB88